MINNGTSSTELVETKGHAVVDYRPVSPDLLVAQVNAIQDAMKRVMKEDVHYGTIPNTKQPTLLKPGAEKILLLFRLKALFPPENIKERELPNGHREIQIVCDVRDSSGVLIGQGVGSCSTMEKKYRYRGTEVRFTGIPLPQGYWDLATKKKDFKGAQRLLEDVAAKAGIEAGAKIGREKNELQQWEIVVKGEPKENADIADVYNTILKMAKKRALVDAAITCTAASDIFKQDLEDLDPEDLPYLDEDRFSRAQNVTPEQPAPTLFKYNISSVLDDELRKKIELVLKSQGAEPDLDNPGTWLAKTEVKKCVNYLVKEENLVN